MSSARTFNPVSANSPEAAATQVTGGPIHAYEITKNAWPAFCGWLTSNLAGIHTSITRVENSDRLVIECLDRPLEKINLARLGDGVPAIHVSVGIDGKSHIFEVAGPSWLRLHYNGAGFAVRLEIGYGEGKLSLQFTGKPASGAIFTGNSWGE